MPRKPRTELDPKLVKRLKYGGAVVVGLTIAAILCIVKGVFKAETPAADKIRYACDAFTVPGVVLLCLGLLSIVVKDGTFDGLGYTFKTMRTVRRNYRDKLNNPTSYYDYKQSVDGKRSISWHLIIVGAGFVLVAVVFAVLHGSMTV